MKASKVSQQISDLANSNLAGLNSNKDVAVSIQFNDKALKEVFMAELRRRARFKGNRGKTYRQLLKTVVV